MRIITGTARGKRLTAAPGLHTRPTADRIKEAIFNIIQFDIEGRKVLDLFCGSGQLALEAISRGAKSAVMVDNDRTARQVVEKNISNCGFDRQCRLSGADALAFLSKAEPNEYGLVFLDPPYDTSLLEAALTGIYQFDIVASGGIIVCESHRDKQLPPPPPPYQLLRQYHYGTTVITTITRL